MRQDKNILLCLFFSLCQLLLKNFGGVYKLEGEELEFDLEDRLIPFIGEEGFLCKDACMSFESYLDESFESYLHSVFKRNDKGYVFDAHNWIKFCGVQSSDFYMYNLNHDGIIKFSFGF
mgnify:CR=1 FL=1